ncbi:hypothetical protein [Bradyrhizobium sp. S69]|uniref:hypothetical protein n=1 Tax=Bradyrhizobium sp. S69 TaxID=1641856 RepID=UPI001AEE042F|nr:hypothetical protein [Bradyrhizobium sp. S69]
MSGFVPETQMREIAELKAKINLLLAMSSLADSELARGASELAQKDTELARGASELAQKNTEIGKLLGEVAQKDREIARVQSAWKQEHKAILASTSWKITAPIRWIKERLGK